MRKKTNSDVGLLILGASTQSAVFVARELSMHNIAVSIVDWHRRPIKSSAYFKKYYDLGSPKVNERRFMDELFLLLKEKKFNYILPIHDPAVEISLKYSDEISRYCQILGVNKPEVQIFARNKWKLIELANQLDISTPQSILIESEHEIESKIGEVNYPCIVKPISSSKIINNKALEFSVTVANSKGELMNSIRESILNLPVIIQSYISGFGIGYNIFALEGEILNAYIHRRINENKGVSSYRESLPVYTFGLQEKVTELIRRTGWTGVAMVEFKIENGVPYLMEINGRFWGSIMVGIKCGLNYPVDLFEMQANGKIPHRNKPIKHVRVRNLREEILLFGNLLVKGHVKAFFRWLISLRKSFLANEYIEDSIFQDPKLIIGFYLNDLKRIINRIRNKPLTIKRNIFEVINNQAENIAFVCMGNICRSPFAAAYAKNKLPQNIYSFGTVDIENRLPPLEAVEAASNYGIDLRSFRSSSISGKDISFIDQFVVMDIINYSHLIDLGVPPEKIYFLSSDDIPDPYKKGIDTFISVYSTIASWIDKYSKN